MTQKVTDILEGMVAMDKALAAHADACKQFLTHAMNGRWKEAAQCQLEASVAIEAAMDNFMTMCQTALSHG